MHMLLKYIGNPNGQWLVNEATNTTTSYTIDKPFELFHLLSAVTGIFLSYFQEIASMKSMVVERWATNRM